MSRAKDDADTLIAAETLDLVCMKDVVALAEDADIKVMLLYFVNSEMTQIIISSFGNKKSASTSSNIDTNLSLTVLDKHSIFARHPRFI